MLSNIFRFKIIPIALVLLMAVMGITACGSTESDSENIKEAGAVISETEDTVTVIDQAGREVTVKKNPESIALCYRVAIRFLLSLDQGDKIKGIGKSEEFLEELQPSLKDAADVGKGVVDIEAMAELNPDLFVHKSSDLEGLEAVEKIGIPSVGIDVETPESMMVAMNLLGKVCGAEEKAQQLIDYYDERLSKTEKLVADIKDDKKKTAIVMGTSIGKVADGTMLQGEMLERAGGINCAENLEATELWPTAGAEQIFEWNPDYIFITGSESAVYTADDIYKDKAWAEMKAVKNKHVFVIPAAADSWEFPGVVSTLGIDFMMKTMYPELLSDEQMEENVNELYQLSYGVTFDRKALGY